MLCALRSILAQIFCVSSVGATKVTRVLCSLFSFSTKVLRVGFVYSTLPPAQSLGKTRGRHREGLQRAPSYVYSEICLVRRRRLESDQKTACRNPNLRALGEKCEPHCLKESFFRNRGFGHCNTSRMISPLCRDSFFSIKIATCSSLGTT